MTRHIKMTNLLFSWHQTINSSASTTNGATTYVLQQTFAELTKKLQSPQTSTNVLWIRNCRTNSDPMASHVLGGLEGS